MWIRHFAFVEDPFLRFFSTKHGDVLIDHVQHTFPLVWLKTVFNDRTTLRLTYSILRWSIRRRQWRSWNLATHSSRPRTARRLDPTSSNRITTIHHLHARSDARYTIQAEWNRESLQDVKVRIQSIEKGYLHCNSTDLDDRVWPNSQPSVDFLSLEPHSR